MQNLPGHLHDMIFKRNCQFSVTGGSQYCGNLMLDRRRYERVVEPEEPNNSCLIIFQSKKKSVKAKIPRKMLIITTKINLL